MGMLMHHTWMKQQEQKKQKKPVKQEEPVKTAPVAEAVQEKPELPKPREPVARRATGRKGVKRR